MQIYTANSKTMKILIYLTGSLGFIASSNLNAQSVANNDLFFSGVVIDDSTGREIPYSHIYNESRRTGAICNESGEFRIIAGPKDTLVFSSLGYLGHVLFLSGSMFSEKQTVRLKPARYEINEVIVRGLRDYESFRKSFINLEIPETQTTRLRDNLATLSKKAGIEGEAEGKRVRRQLQPNIHPIENGIPILYKEDLQRMNLKRVKKQEARQRMIAKKYNREFIMRLTKLPEEEVTGFMSFCNFSEEFLYEATAYEIGVIILEKHEQYIQERAAGAETKTIAD